jgi:hypothetical protein
MLIWFSPRQCDGSVYVGEFCRGVFHGHGELKDVAGGVYSGEWKDGLRHGNGKLSNSVGTYEGKLCLFVCLFVF